MDLQRTPTSHVGARELINTIPLHIGTKMKNHLLVHDHLGELKKYKGCVKLVKDGDFRGWQKCKNRKIMIGHW
jgi:hypothetical protein